MKTIKAINTLFRDFELRVERSVARTEKELATDIRLAQEDILNKFKMLRQIFPDILQINYDSAVSKGETDRIVRNLAARAAHKYHAPVLATGEAVRHNLLGTEFLIPHLTEWQTAQGKPNFVIDYTGATHDKAKQVLNTLVGNILISLPPKAAHLTFVDMSYTKDAALFTSNLLAAKNTVWNAYYDHEELRNFCHEISTRMKNLYEECEGTLAEYNVKYQKLHYPYEVIVLLNYPNNFDHFTDILMPIFRNGHNAGIYFVVMNNMDIVLDKHRSTLLSEKDSYYTINLNNAGTGDRSALVYPTSLLDNMTVSEAIFKYIVTEATKEAEIEPVEPDYEGLYQKSYEPLRDAIEFPIGVTSTGQVIDFKLNISDYVNTFVIGRAGSGKSSFLNRIIESIMLKYSPEDVQLYLMDFKKVEFTPYKGSKHVKSLIVDAHDLQLTLQALKHLEQTMNDRRDHITEAGYKDIVTYNDNNPGQRMPRIIMIADECQMMFDDGTGKNRMLYAEIGKLISNIARLGRFVGIHLLLATQTIAEVSVPTGVIGQIHNHFILPSKDNDAERLVSGSSRITSTLAKGQVYYKGPFHETMFQYYHVIPGKIARVQELINKKTKPYKLADQFVYDGGKEFSVDSDVISKICGSDEVVASVGLTIDLELNQVQIPVVNDFAENMMFFGINDKAQVTRVVMNAIITACLTARKTGIRRRIQVLNCISNRVEGISEINRQLDRMNELGWIEHLGANEAGRVISRITRDIEGRNVTPTILVILGEENIVELKRNMKPELTFGESDLSDYVDFEGNSPRDSDKMTYRDKLNFILENGPRAGVNTFIQLDDPKNLYIVNGYGADSKTIYDLFNHLIMLRSKDTVGSFLRLDNDIHLENLESELKHMRAYYYSGMARAYTLFVPFVSIDSELLK